MCTVLVSKRARERAREREREREREGGGGGKGRILYVYKINYLLIHIIIRNIVTWVA